MYGNVNCLELQRGQEIQRKYRLLDTKKRGRERAYKKSAQRGYARKQYIGI